MAYDWDFGDGAPHLSSPSPTHVYASGTYTATLQVSDGKGGTATASVRIDAGNTPPTPKITTPSKDLRFRVGQSIVLSGSAIDPQDGVLAADQLSWRVLLHHNEHTHPFVSPTAGSSITMTAPPPEELAATATSYLEIELTVTDSRGLTSVITQELRPNLVNLTFATAPSGLVLAANDSAIVAPRTA